MKKVINYYQAKTNSLKQKKKINLKFLNVGLMSLFIVFGVLHLMNISDLTVKGFIIKELKTQANVLASEKLGNEEKVNSLQSYYTLNSRTAGLNMVIVDEIDYLSVPGSTVARK